MIKYKNEEYLRQVIMEQSRHLFIYGYDGSIRKRFLEDVTSRYPLILDKNSPTGVYIDDYGLPKIPNISEKLDKGKIDLVSHEFLSFSIAISILLKAKADNDVGVLNERIKKLIDVLNRGVNRDYPRLGNLDDIIKVFAQSKEFYRNYYMKYCGKGIETASINDISMPFIELDMFIRYLKSCINNDSYFAIIIDKQSEIALSSTRAINSLVNSRNNSDISMKVVVEPDKWDTYVDINGQLIEYVHDYGTVELDDSQSQYMKRMKKQ